MVLALILLGTVSDGRDPRHRRRLMGGLAHLGGLCPRRVPRRAGVPLVPVRGRPARSDHPHEARNQRLLARFWLVACVTLTALGINKQLDLQSLFTQLLRDAARLQGWCDRRRSYQFAFVVVIAGAGVGGRRGDGLGVASRAGQGLDRPAGTDVDDELRGDPRRLFPSCRHVPEKHHPRGNRALNSRESRWSRPAPCGPCDRDAATVRAVWRPLLGSSGGSPPRIRPGPTESCER